ncbi:MAG: serine/threonine protein kinase [Betaproteobacteria bacterium]|nr:serine/threonine protein kinase [Betaproteobacteria bacterium]
MAAPAVLPALPLKRLRHAGRELALPLKRLRHAGRELALPLDIILPDGRALRLEEIRRVLPGQRYVGVASFAGRTVLAKLFVGNKAAKRFAAEKAGALLLAAQALPTPSLLDGDFALEEQAGWLLFEYLIDAKTLADKLTTEQYRESVFRAAAAIAQLHARGLWQEDLHPGNLLEQDGKLFWIDGGGIRAEQPGQALSAPRALDNYALFLAQLPLRQTLAENVLTALCAAYHTANPLSAKGWLPSTLIEAVTYWRQARVRDWLRKIKRDCSNFARRQKGWRGAFGLTMTRREEAEALAPLLADPDAFIAEGEIYKDKGAATVARVTLNDRQLVIKRYNIKNLRHRLKRCWRESRAWVSWREGNRMLALGIETAKPLAVIEERSFWLRGRAWLIMEHVEGENALAQLQSPEQHQEIEAIKTLLAELEAARLSHGDMKGTNLIWRAESEKWALLDLDSMRAHRCDFAWQRARRRDLARLLRNWPDAKMPFQDGKSS